MAHKAQANSFARKVKSQLALRGLTLGTLAESLGVHRVSVSRAINHPPQNPEVARRVRELFKLA